MMGPTPAPQPDITDRAVFDDARLWKLTSALERQLEHLDDTWVKWKGRSHCGTESAIVGGMAEVHELLAAVKAESAKRRAEERALAMAAEPEGWREARDLARIHAEGLLEALERREEGTRLDADQLYEVVQTLRDMTQRLAERRFTYGDAARASLAAHIKAHADASNAGRAEAERLAEALFA